MQQPDITATRIILHEKKKNVDKHGRTNDAIAANENTARKIAATRIFSTCVTDPIYRLDVNTLPPFM